MKFFVSLRSGNELDAPRSALWPRPGNPDFQVADRSRCFADVASVPKPSIDFAGVVCCEITSDRWHLVLEVSITDRESRLIKFADHFQQDQFILKRDSECYFSEPIPTR